MLTIKILTSQEVQEDIQGDLVLVPGYKGEIGILERHISMVSMLEPGVVNIYQGAKSISSIFIFGGILEVSDDTVTIMTEKSSAIIQLDIETARKNLAVCQEEQKNADYDQSKKLRKDALLYSRIIETSQKH